MRTSLVLVAALAAVLLFLPRSDARSLQEPHFAIEIDRVEGIDELTGLEDPDLLRAVAVVETVKGDPLPGLKALAQALFEEFGAAEVLDGGPTYVWEIDPQSGELVKICIDRDSVVVARDGDPNPIVVRLVTRVVLD